MADTTNTSRSQLRDLAKERARSEGRATTYIGQRGTVPEHKLYLAGTPYEQAYPNDPKNKLALDQVDISEPVPSVPTLAAEPMENVTAAAVPPVPDNLLLNWSSFISKYNSTAKPLVLNREKFITTFSKHHVRSKKDGKLFAPATFFESRSRENFISASGICLDFDHGKPVVKQVLELLHGTTAAYYSTFSHVPENPRFRVVIPLSRTVNADEHDYLVAGIKTIIPPELMDCLDTSCFEKARSHYLPSCPPEHECHAFAGCQDGMVNLLSGLKRIRALATEKHCVAQEKAGERIFPTYPIQRQGEHKWKSYSR